MAAPNGATQWLVLKRVLRASTLGGSKLWSCFSPFVVQSSPNVSRDWWMFATPFPVWRSCCIPQIIAIKSRNWPSVETLMSFGRPMFLGEPQISERIFFNMGRRRTCDTVWWRSTERPWRLGGEKKKKKQRNMVARPACHNAQYTPPTRLNSSCVASASAVCIGLNKITVHHLFQWLYSAGQGRLYPFAIVVKRAITSKIKHAIKT